MTSRKDACLFLKAIQIQGFKSFADNIRIDMQPGLSVIVGPNGSGKSNIADAVRWVLGEQSAKSLRGNKMEDVIFAGSSTRKPIGMAEVSLIFDNSSGIFPVDYEEVVITRRVFRDGEGYFYINKTPCRLKDIQELLFDTGSGKEGFSIISQGRVDEILNLKSEERRLLIEEVAGISKFRMRKKEALKKLEDTEQNLNRVNDIISEVETYLEPLAKQAELAETCQKLTKQLGEAEITHIVYGLSEIESKLKEVQSQKVELNESLTLLNSEIVQKEDKNIKNNVEINQLEEKIQNLQAKTYMQDNKLKELTHHVSLLVERQNHTLEKSTRLEQEKKLAELQITRLKEKLKELNQKESALQESLQDDVLTVKKLENELFQLKGQSDIEQAEKIKTEIFEELSNKSRILNNIGELENKKTILCRQEEQLSKEIKEKEEAKDNLRKTILENENKQNSFISREQEISQEIKTVERELQQQKNLYLETEKQKNALQRKIDQTVARLNALQGLENNMEGYHQGVKEIVFAARQKKIQCSGIYGTVSDIIEVEEKFELALETALGNSLQNIITETTEDGKKCIEYLKRNNKGRVTILPLDAVRGSRISLNSFITAHKGFQGLAVDLIRFDERYRNIMEFLLGRIIVADNLDAAIELARMNNFRYRIVTLLGDQVNIGGSLTGGSTKKQNSSLLSRPREIEEISRFLKDLNSENEAFEQKIVNTKNKLDGLIIRKDSLEKELINIKENQKILTYEKKHIEERLAQLEQSSRVLHYEIKDTKKDLEELEPKLNEYSKLLELSEQKVSNLRAKQTELDKIERDSKVQIQELSDRITAAKVEVARQEQEFCQIRQLIVECKNEIKETQELIDQKTEEINNLQKFQQELRKEQQDIEQSIQELTDELDNQKFLLTQIRKEKETKVADTIKLEEDIRLMRRQAREKEQRMHQFELRTTRWQTEWENGLKRLMEEYNLTWEAAKSYQTTEPKEDLQQRIQDLKHRIESLGPINYNALQEYPETLNRFEFLTAQREDLVEASNSLLELVQELDENMKKRFEEGFKAVNQAFKEVFKELFQGGFAELILDDPTNLLETGVTIIAQPPGKKPQLLSLLSGGERAFTAIALLFSFLKVKPSPFCLLDEIEAALDEANVKRFVQYLRKLSSKTQFIVISHRRGTMEAADTLYGVTMEESGVSKLLTVELTEEAG